MKNIPFTQYKMPHGKKVDVTIARSDNIADKAHKLIDDGFIFECEMLMTGAISLTISDGKQDLAIELCTNGPEVLSAVDRLISEFKITTYK